MHGLGYDVVTSLVQPFQFQGYQVYCDNFYSSPHLFTALQTMGILATGTLSHTRVGVPNAVKQLKAELQKKATPLGAGYYIREPGSSLVYVCWKDNKVLTMISTAHPGHTTTHSDKTLQCFYGRR